MTTIDSWKGHVWSVDFFSKGQNIIQWGKSFQQILLEQLDGYLYVKKCLNPYLTLYRKINLKWLIDLNIQTEAIKCIGRIIRENLCGLEIGNDCFRTQKALTNHRRKKLLSQTFIKSKTFCSTKYIGRKWKGKSQTGRIYYKHTYAAYIHTHT